MTYPLPRRFFRLLIVPLLVVASMFATGCATDRQIIGQANQFHDNLEPAVIEDPVLANYLQDVGDRIIEAAAEYGRPEDSKWMFDGGMKFHFVNSKTLNAFTTGGNHMYIYTGLLQNCDTEDELAAVMAHEFAHVYGRHVHKGMNRQMMTLAAAAGAGAAGYAAGGKNRETYAGTAAGLAMMAGQFFGQSFTREDENEADALGFKFYVRAGWEPENFDDFFQKMIEKGYDKTPEILSDHPSLANRVAATKKRVANLPPEADRWQRPPVADVREFRRLQQRAEEVGRNMPTDQTLANSQELLRAMPRSCLTPLDQDEKLRDQHEAQMNIIEALQRQQAREGGRAQQAAAPRGAAVRARAMEADRREQRALQRRGYN